MKLSHLLKIADRHYPDGMILAHWDRKAKAPVLESQGDTLAFFIVLELFGTDNPSLSDVRKLEDAALRMTVAAHELLGVSVGLVNEAARRSARRRHR